MKKLLKPIFFLLVLINFFFASWYFLHNDLVFSSDIARDLLLMGQIKQKIFVLIGPKSSVMGLFHGPLWLYLNFPAYLLGHGNPVMVGWWWVILTAIFVVSCFYIAKKLFDTATAYVYVLIMSLYMSFHTNSFINPIGAMFVIPAFFYFFIRYLQTNDIKYLLAHVFVIGLIIQFEMAIGIPFMMLSFLILFIKIIRSENKKHLWGFLIILIPLSTFIIFDLRHNFLLTQGVLRYLSPSSGDWTRFSFVNLISDRFHMMISQVEFVRPDPNFRNLIFSLIFIAFLAIQIKNKKNRLIYFSFIYFYVGYFVATFINRGPILSFYFYPLFALVFLIFASFITSKYSKIFIVVFVIVYLMNFSTAILDAQSTKNFTGKDLNSWSFLNEMSSKLYTGNEKEFGYFVYTPDTLGYAPKYALQYQRSLHPNMKVDYLSKQPVTYIVVAPPAIDNPYLSYTWWRNVRVKINKNPVSTITFPNGYKIEKYLLSPEEMKIPFDPGIDPGLGFR